jgi:hypothetical protein
MPVLNLEGMRKRKLRLKKPGLYGQKAGGPKFSDAAYQYPIPQREPLIGIIRSPSSSGSKGKGKFQQYACAHQDNCEWVVGWHSALPARGWLF